MVLVVRPKCVFCTPEIVKKITKLGGKILTAVLHPDGSAYLTDDGSSFVPFPQELPGIPALINERDVYVGEGPIRQFLEETK